MDWISENYLPILVRLPGSFQVRDLVLSWSFLVSQVSVCLTWLFLLALELTYAVGYTQSHLVPLSWRQQ